MLKEFAPFLKEAAKLTLSMTQVRNEPGVFRMILVVTPNRKMPPAQESVIKAWGPLIFKGTAEELDQEITKANVLSKLNERINYVTDGEALATEDKKAKVEAKAEAKATVATPKKKTAAKEAAPTKTGDQLKLIGAVVDFEKHVKAKDQAGAKAYLTRIKAMLEAEKAAGIERDAELFARVMAIHPIYKELPEQLTID